MKQTILLFAILLSGLTSAYAQTTLRIYNHTGCTIQANVNETTACTASVALGVSSINAFSFIDIRSSSTGAEFEVEVIGTWSIPSVYTDITTPCSPQIASSAPTIPCVWVVGFPLSTATSTVIDPAMDPGIDKQVNVTW